MDTPHTKITPPPNNHFHPAVASIALQVSEARAMDNIHWAASQGERIAERRGRVLSLDWLPLNADVAAGNCPWQSGHAAILCHVTLLDQ
jgi:hypothetical protein